MFGRFHAVLRRDHLAATLRDPREIEVTSRLSELYPFIEERHGSLPKALNDVDADDEDDSLDESAVEEMRAKDRPGSLSGQSRLRLIDDRMFL